jgi:hypothetical protein
MEKPSPGFTSEVFSPPDGGWNHPARLLSRARVYERLEERMSEVMAMATSPMALRTVLV